MAWILLITLVALLMLPNLLWLVYWHLAITTWLSALLLPTALLTTWFALLGRRLWLACLLLTPVALLAPLEAFYIATYHAPSTATIIATLLATTPQETGQYLGQLLPAAITAPLLGLALAVLAAWTCRRRHLRWRGRSRQWVAAVAMLVALPLVVVSISTQMETPPRPTPSHPPEMEHGLALVGPGYPFGVLVRLGKFAWQWSSMRSDSRRLASFDFHASHRAPIPQQRQIYVLVIGESSARGHWQLFGYDRPTNPQLSKLANLITLKRMVSSWPETITAVPIMLTRKPITSNQPSWHEPSFLPAMQEAGYQTWWISNQYPIGKFDSPVAMYAYEAQNVVWTNHTTDERKPGAYDEALLAPFKQAIAHSHGDLFIVLHMMGSHRFYDYRYPRGFGPFQPTLTNGKKGAIYQKNLVNSYDNTIAYTDHVLAQVIGMLKQSGAVTALWYESDHGETLPHGACSAWGHGHGNAQEFEIPAFVWYSDSYARDFPRRLAALRANADKRTLSGDTFASLIDMAGVALPSQDETWSLFSPQWHYRKRFVAQYWYTDFDHARPTGSCGILKPAS